MFMFHLYYTGCVFVYLMYIYLSSEINIYLSIYLRLSDVTVGFPCAGAAEDGNTGGQWNGLFISEKICSS